MNTKKENIDIIFLDGITFCNENDFAHFIAFLFPLGKIIEDNSFSYKVLNLKLLSDYSIGFLIKELKMMSFKAIGISTHADNVKWIYKIVNQIKVHFPEIPIILGGPQVSFSGNTILENCNCDILVKHEGEKKLIEILNYYIRGKSQLKNINGIAFRDNGEIVNTPEAELIDLDTLPSPDYSILTNFNHWHIPQDCPPEKAKRFLEHILRRNKGYISSRGCPYNCIFCVEGNLKQKHRMRSIENVEKDLRLFLSQTGLKFINFMDDTFTSSRKRVLEMCDMINRIRKDYDFRWYVEGRVNILAENLDLIDIMVDSGLTYLQVGIESGSQKVLDAQNKRITTDQLKVVFSKIGELKNKNIAIVGNIILGNAGETEESLIETLNFAKELYKLANFNASITFGFLVPFQGTPIKENPNKYGLKILDENFELNMIQFREVICLPNNLNTSTLYSRSLLSLQTIYTE